MFYVYILKSIKYNKTYVGHTDDVLKRVEEHNKEKSIYTSIYKPWKLTHTEQFETEQEAIDREKYIKTHIQEERK